jgi:transposase
MRSTPGKLSHCGTLRPAPLEVCHGSDSSPLLRDRRSQRIGGRVPPVAGWPAGEDRGATLVDAIPLLQGDRGRPRHRPDCVMGDRGYDAEAIRQGLRDRRITPFLAKRNTEHGSGLGRWRWVVERTFSWLNQFRRLRVRYEKRADIHEAFLSLGCALICWYFLRVDWVAS